MIADHIFSKKVSLIVFRHKFYPKFCLWRTLSVSQSWLIWKSSLELNCVIQNNVQQDYLLPCRIKWFWLIIAGSPPLSKGRGVGVLSIIQKDRGGGGGSCFRNRHQYKIFSYRYSIIFLGGGWKGNHILKYRFSFTDMTKMLLELSSFISINFNKICHMFSSKVQ